MSRMKWLPIAAIMASALAGPSVAMDATFDLPQALALAPRGSVVLLMGEIANHSDQDLYLNGISSTVLADFGGADQFEPLLGLLPMRLDPGEIWEGPILKLTVAPGAALGMQTFHVSLIGGDHHLDAGIIGTKAFVIHTDDVLAVETPPVAIRAFRASPNPFIAKTTVEFRTSAPAAGSVAVYDVRGAQVAVLFDGVMKAGDHRFEWNGRDTGAKRCAAGVYFIRVTSAGLRLKTKVVRID